MHPRLAELTDLLARERAALLAALATIPPDLRARRPAPDLWSAAEVLDHLARTETGVARLFQKRLGAARAAGALGPELETSSVLGALDHTRLRDRTRRIEAPEMVQPRPEADAAEALAALEAARAALLAELLPADGLALGGLTHPHPMLGQLTLYEWLLFLAQHEGRHAAQLAEIGRRQTAGAARA